MRSYPRPKTFEEFEQVCVEYLRREWKRPGLVRFARSGEEQDGVDIIDLGTPDDCWAAQCKLHEAQKALQAAEVLAEVAKADEFPHRITRYAVCSTGRKTGHTQTAVLKLNEARKAEGKFLVGLVYWEDIELRLDADDTFKEQYLSSSHSSVRAVIAVEVEKGVKRSMAPVAIQLEGLREEVRETGERLPIDADLDRARRLLDENKYAAAEVLLRELFDTKLDRLSPLQLFRCLSNLGVIEARRGNDLEAGRLILRASEEYSAHEKAKVNRAHALNLLGRDAEAWAAVQEARNARPDDPGVAAAYAAYAPLDIPLDTLSEELRAFASQASVLLVFSRRCLESEDFDQALQFAERVTVLGHESAELLFVRGHATVGPHLPDDPRDSIQDAAARRQASTAIEMLSRAAVLAETEGDPRLAIRCRLFVVDVAGYLDQPKVIEDALEEALRLAAGQPQSLIAINVMRSQMALAGGQFARAVEYADRALQHGHDIHAVILRAVALMNRNEGADREMGRRELRKHLPQLTGAHLEQALDIIVTDQVGQRRYDGAADAIRIAKESGLDLACALAQEARVAEANNDSERAQELSKQAAAALEEESSVSTRRLVATVLRRCQQPGLAADVLRPIASRVSLTQETRTLLALAMEAKRDDLVLEWSKELWTHGALDATARWNYLILLDAYDPRAALRVASEAIAGESDPQELGALKARRTLMQLRLGVPVDAVVLADLPPAGSADVHYVALFVEALLRSGLGVEAAHYAYQGVLRFPDEPSTHAALIRVFLFRINAEPEVAEPTEVQVGCSVQIQEGDDPPIWYTIEAERASGLRDVVAVADPPANLLLGKRVGDSVTLAPGTTGPRIAVVKAVMSAVIFRFNDSMNTWQIRFPSHPLLEQSRFDKDPDTGELDIGPLVAFLKKRVEIIDQIDAVYRGGAMPIAFLADRAGRSLFETMGHLAFDDELFVNCVHGVDEAFQNAINQLDNARGVVLDGTAVWTLHQLGLADVLETLPIAFGTVQQTLDAIQVETSAETPGRESGLLTLVGDRAALQEVPAEARERYRASWRGVAAALAKGSVLPTESLASLPSERREQLITYVGSWTTHAMAAAKEHGFVLWSDDRVVEFLAKESFGVTRIWTQAVLHWLARRGLLDDTRLKRASAQLQACRYAGTFINAEVLVEAARLASWRLGQAVFARKPSRHRGPRNRPARKCEHGHGAHRCLHDRGAAGGFANTCRVCHP